MSTSWEDNAAAVLDNGSGNVKFGFAGDDAPKVVFPAVVGHPRGADAGGAKLVGDEALKASNEGTKLTMNYPLEHGIVQNWEDMERVWRAAYQQLNVDPSNHACLVTEAPMNPKQNREKMIQTLFESMGVPALNIQIQAVLALYNAGRTEGVVVDCGDGVTHTVPIYESRTVPTAIRRLDLAGRDLTEWMMTLLSDETDFPYTSTAHREQARQIKEMDGFCYVAEDFQYELDKSEDPEGVKEMEKEMTLPDGNKVSVSRARFICPEILFQPSIAEKPCDPLPKLIAESVEGCGIDIRRTLLQNIVLSGGTTMFKGIEKRLANEVRALVPPRAQDDVKIIAPPERKYSIWIGGNILGGLGSFQQEYITKQEYDEAGPNIVHKRCDAFGFVEK